VTLETVFDDAIFDVEKVVAIVFYSSDRLSEEDDDV
jgi:hypothetical protein